jgi:hypothetical protein
MSGPNSKPQTTTLNRDQLLTKGDLEDFRNDLILEIKTLLQDLKVEPTKTWLRSKEVRKILNISPGTLQTLRINRIISYSRLGKIPYYKHSEIIERLRSPRT